MTSSQVLGIVRSASQSQGVPCDECSGVPWEVVLTSLATMLELSTKTLLVKVMVLPIEITRSAFSALLQFYYKSLRHTLGPRTLLCAEWQCRGGLYTEGRAEDDGQVRADKFGIR